MNRIFSLTGAAVIALGVLCSSGCAIDYPVRLKAPAPKSDRHVADRHIAVVATETLRQKIHDSTGMMWIGAAHHWRAKSGEALIRSTLEVCKLHFESVELVSDLPLPGKRKDLVIEPDLRHVVTDPVSMGTSLAVHYRISDRDGHYLLEFDSAAESSFGGQQLGGILLGVAGGSSAMSGSVSDAFNKETQEFSDRLDQAVVSGIFGRAPVMVQTTVPEISIPIMQPAPGLPPDQSVTPSAPADLAEHRADR